MQRLPHSSSCSSSICPALSPDKHAYGIALARAPFAGCAPVSAASIGKAIGRVEGQPEVPPKCADRGAVFGVGIAVAVADDDRAKLTLVLASRWQHGGDEGLAFGIAEGEEDRHHPLDVLLEANVLLKDTRRARRHIAARSLLPGLPKIFFDRVVHCSRFQRSFPLRLDPKPGFRRGIAHELHDALLRKLSLSYGGLLRQI